MGRWVVGGWAVGRKQKAERKGSVLNLESQILNQYRFAARSGYLPTCLPAHLPICPTADLPTPPDWS